MPKRNDRIDTNSNPDPLTTNPFAALAGQLPADLPQQPSNTPCPDRTPSSYEGHSPSLIAKPQRPFTIQRTRKGGYPISLEKRPSGKVVTVLRNVSGDAEALLKLLKKRCGAGGCLAENAVEIQGDHRLRIEAILNE